MRKIKYGSGGWEARREHGWLGVVIQSSSEKVTFEQTPERRNGVSHVNFWEKTVQADRRANVKALWKEQLRISESR